MSLTKTPVCNFGDKIINFSLKSTENENIRLSNIKGPKGTLVIFICNHCPYVRAVISEIVETSNELRKNGISTIAIMSNDTAKYKEDSFDNMKVFAKDNLFNFPYLIDENQEIAKKFGAVCTPDFFGYNSKDELQYRGRLREMKELKPVPNKPNELLFAMKQISETGSGPNLQFPSMGCNIKWK
ncbi:MAG: thioredoxin family protein [Candidatus Pelagibacter sp.]|nr:thioredoxin family protein [Candidatus Pelagibacter sp.]OUV97756.1 MAG: thioredoxin family protein [Candidatus Pelagibacter sp. TMED142]